MDKSDNSRIIVGWREWLVLPELGIPAIKAKIDTGARTSALHTFDLHTFRSKGKLMVKFGIHPLQRKLIPEIYCTAEVLDKRIVSDSGGHREERYVIQTVLSINEKSWTIQITLTDRSDMRFRMLLGREAMNHNISVRPDKSYLTGKELAKTYKRKSIL